MVFATVNVIIHGWGNVLEILSVVALNAPKKYTGNALKGGFHAEQAIIAKK